MADQSSNDIKTKLHILAATQHEDLIEAELGIATIIQQIVHQQGMNNSNLEPIDRSKKPSQRQLDFTDY